MPGEILHTQSQPAVPAASNNLPLESEIPRRKRSLWQSLVIMLLLIFIGYGGTTFALGYLLNDAVILGIFKGLVEIAALTSLGEAFFAGFIITAGVLALIGLIVFLYRGDNFDRFLDFCSQHKFLAGGLFFALIATLTFFTLATIGIVATAVLFAAMPYLLMAAVGLAIIFGAGMWAYNAWERHVEQVEKIASKIIEYEKEENEEINLRYFDLLGNDFENKKEDAEKAREELFEDLCQHPQRFNNFVDQTKENTAICHRMFLEVIVKILASSDESALKQKLFGMLEVSFDNGGKVTPDTDNQYNFNFVFLLFQTYFFRTTLSENGLELIRGFFCGVIIKNEALINSLKLKTGTYYNNRSASEIVEEVLADVRQEPRGSSDLYISESLGVGGQPQSYSMSSSHSSSCIPQDSHSDTPSVVAIPQRNLSDAENSDEKPREAKQEPELGPYSTASSPTSDFNIIPQRPS